MVMEFRRLNQLTPNRSARQAGGELASPRRTSASTWKKTRIVIHTWALLTATSMLSGCATLDEAKVVVADATEFLVALDAQPNASAAGLFPQAAKANKNVFYTRGSKDPRTVREVHELFRQKIESA